MKIISALLLCLVCVVCSCAKLDYGRVKTLSEVPTDRQRIFLKGHAGDYRAGSDRVKGLSSPPIQKPYADGSALVDLVASEQIKLGRKPLAEVINSRRSRRDYSEEALSLEELSYLLWSTQGIQKINKDEAGNVESQFRTVPSGGARHPFETYLLINRVSGVPAGVYRYLAVEHKLLPLFSGDGLAQRISAACYGQEWTGKSAVTFVWAAVPYRTEWKYAYVSPKMIAIEAGHVCQNLYLAVESIDAGVCALLGYNQVELDNLLGIDGKDEFAVYMAAVGKLE